MSPSSETGPTLAVRRCVRHNSRQLGLPESFTRETKRMNIPDFVDRLRRSRHLSADEMSAAIDVMMQGRCREQEIADLLLALRAKGETVDEIAGAALAMRKHMTRIRTSRSGVIDTCGTGGDASGTFNISTGAALVAAAAGVPVAKHGNRSVTSKSGSADVLAALGVDIEAPVEVVERCLEQVGICFCFAPLLHPAMRHVAPVRKRLGVPTVFNLLGPLCNPAAAPYQLMGVGRGPLRPLLAAALQRLGSQRAVVVCGRDGLDEVTLADETEVSDVTPEGVAGDGLVAGGVRPAAGGLDGLAGGRTGGQRGVDPTGARRAPRPGSRHRRDERRRGAVDGAASGLAARSAPNVAAAALDSGAAKTAAGRPGGGEPPALKNATGSPGGW